MTQPVIGGGGGRSFENETGAVLDTRSVLCTKSEKRIRSLYFIRSHFIAICFFPVNRLYNICVRQIITCIILNRSTRAPIFALPFRVSSHPPSTHDVNWSTAIRPTRYRFRLLRLRDTHKLTRMHFLQIIKSYL